MFTLRCVVTFNARAASTPYITRQKTSLIQVHLSPAIPSFTCLFMKVFHVTAQEAHHKRRRQPDQKSLRNGMSQHQPKKRKRGDPSQPPPAFWDNLSEIPLTRRALQELDRRNRESSNAQVHGPVTQRIIAEARQAAKHVARQGGPDLSELRGVCMDANRFLALYADVPLSQYPKSSPTLEHTVSMRSSSSPGRRK